MSSINLSRHHAVPYQREGNMILVSHPTGNANVRAVVRALDGAGELDCFFTTLGVSEHEPANWANRPFQKRRFPVLNSRLKLAPVRECVRLAAAKLGCKWLTRHETGWASVDSVYGSLDRAVSDYVRQAGSRLNGIYGYEDGAWLSFRMAKELGIKRFYDLPIAYWQTAHQLLLEESERLPGWAPTLGGLRDSPAKLERKTEELELAQAVICPSSFVANSLPATVRKRKQVVIAPFGSPVKANRKQAATQNGKLRVLFAGSMTQRKGLGDLFAGIKQLNRQDVELVVMGAPQIGMEFYRSELSHFTHEPTRPHAQVLDLMRQCDVFCLPSIVEGRALVMQEAMSQGLPLIITPNTGGEDLIEEGVTGFLTPIRRPDLIAERIAWFADNRSRLPEMSLAAQKKADTLTWEAYGQIIVNAVRQNIQEPAEYRQEPYTSEIVRAGHSNHHTQP